MGPLLPVHQDVVAFCVHCKHTKVHRIEHGVQQPLLALARVQHAAELDVLLLHIALLPHHAQGQDGDGNADSQ
jgi:hypothetical protein